MTRSEDVPCLPNLFRSAHGRSLPEGRQPNPSLARVYDHVVPSVLLTLTPSFVKSAESIISGRGWRCVYARLLYGCVCTRTQLVHNSSSDVVLTKGTKRAGKLGQNDETCVFR